jgi:hypothetical protein
MTSKQMVFSRPAHVYMYIVLRVRNDSTNRYVCEKKHDAERIDRSKGRGGGGEDEDETFQMSNFEQNHDEYKYQKC